MRPADRAPARDRDAPTTPLPRQLQALGRANAVRSARARLKSELASNRARIEDVLAHPAAFAENARVSDLMLAVPGFGPARATRALVRCQIPHEGTVAGLSERQRLALIGLFTGRTA